MKIPKDRTFEELSIAAMCEVVQRGWENIKECKDSLGNIGIKVKDNNIYIANENNNLAEILKGSRWPHNWNQTLKRLPFATQSKSNVYFSPACKQRAIILPVDKVIAVDN